MPPAETPDGESGISRSLRPEASPIPMLMKQATRPMTPGRRAELLAAYERHARRFALDASHRRGASAGPRITVQVPRTRDLEPSGRQLEVLKLIADGCTNHEIADALHVSEETVKSHVKELAGRLGARSRAHTVSLAYRSGLLPAQAPSADPVDGNPCVSTA